MGGKNPSPCSMTNLCCQLLVEGSNSRVPLLYGSITCVEPTFLWCWAGLAWTHLFAVVSLLPASASAPGQQCLRAPTLPAKPYPVTADGIGAARPAAPSALCSQAGAGLSAGVEWWRVTSHRPQFCNYRIFRCLHSSAALAASATRGKRACFCVGGLHPKVQ